MAWKLTQALIHGNLISHDTQGDLAMRGAEEGQGSKSTIPSSSLRLSMTATSDCSPFAATTLVATRAMVGNSLRWGAWQTQVRCGRPKNGFCIASCTGQNEDASSMASRLPFEASSFVGNRRHGGLVRGIKILSDAASSCRHALLNCVDVLAGHDRWPPSRLSRLG